MTDSARPAEPFRDETRRHDAKAFAKRVKTKTTVQI